MCSLTMVGPLTIVLVYESERANTKGIVGGEVLDLALARAKPHARFVICGGSSDFCTNLL